MAHVTPHPPQARRAELGAQAAEYGLLLAGIVAIIVGAIYALGPRIAVLFTNPVLVEGLS